MSGRRARWSSAARVGAIALLIAWCAWCAGCATRIVPPPPTPAQDAVPVFVTNYGRHSSLLLTAPEGHLNEYAFGDWNWFAENRTGSGDAVRAMLYSAGSTVGRRQLHFSDDVHHLSRATGAATVIAFPAPRERVNALIAQLDSAYDARIDTITYNPWSGLWFVRSREPYGLFHNCNHMTADWLRALGCQIRGPAMFSNFRVAPPKAAATQRPATQPAR